MNELNKKLFVKCWKAEHEATVKIHNLQDKIDSALTREAPTQRLENSLAYWKEKQDVALNSIMPLVESGVIGEDATSTCSDQLGKLGGYVADCYYTIWVDYKPEDLTEEEYLIAKNEGWVLSEILDVTDNDDSHQLQFFAESDIFKTDDEAWDYVISKALDGSELHEKAILFIKKTSINEFRKFIKDAKVIKADTANEKINDDTKHWFLEFPNGEAVGFKYDRDAYYAQRKYRNALNLDVKTGE